MMKTDAGEALLRCSGSSLISERKSEKKCPRVKKEAIAGLKPFLQHEAEEKVFLLFELLRPGERRIALHHNLWLSLAP
jgi:hypothetical protein